MSKIKKTIVTSLLIGSISLMTACGCTMGGGDETNATDATNSTNVTSTRENNTSESTTTKRNDTNETSGTTNSTSGTTDNGTNNNNNSRNTTTTEGIINELGDNISEGINDITRDVTGR